MIGQRVARRYAKALVELAEGEGRMDSVGEELDGMARIFDESVELRNLMFNPAVLRVVKRKVLEELIRRAQASDLLGRFLRVVLDKGRLRHLVPIAAAYRELADARRNRVRARVRAAFALSAEEEETLRRQLSAATGKEVVLEVETDEALLGGLKAQLGSSIWDGSVRSRLERLRERLVRRA